MLLLLLLLPPPLLLLLPLMLLLRLQVRSSFAYMKMAKNTVEVGPKDARCCNVGCRMAHSETTKPSYCILQRVTCGDFQKM